MKRLSAVIAFLASTAGAIPAYAASCQTTRAVYTMTEAPGWELRLPMEDKGLFLAELEQARMVTLYSREKKKTYEFGWMFTNGTFAEYLVPLWIKAPVEKAVLRVYTFDKGNLTSGLPSPDASAPEGIFLADFDFFFRYRVDSVEDIDHPGVGIWKLASCEG